MLDSIYHMTLNYFEIALFEQKRLYFTYFVIISYTRRYYGRQYKTFQKYSGVPKYIGTFITYLY